MKLCILVPAYNCSDTIAEVCRRVVLPGPEDEILIVDTAAATERSRLPEASPGFMPSETT